MSKLAGLVGISVSDPGDAELRLRGLAADHVTHLFIELARQVLAAGGDLAYGGDLCAEGYTQTLVSLLRTYSRADRPSRSRVRQYLARYVWEPMSTSEASALAAYLTPVRVAGGGDAEDDRVARALDLTAMRRQMSGEIEARVLLGGRLSGQLGRWPGVVEEAYLALAVGRPLFVCGGIGGAGARIAKALGGAWPDELTDEFQRGASGLGYQALVEATGPSEEALRAAFAEAAPPNGLSARENALLMETVDLDLIVALVLRGLTRVCEMGGSRGDGFVAG